MRRMTLTQRAPQNKDISLCLHIFRTYLRRRKTGAGVGAGVVGHMHHNLEKPQGPIHSASISMRITSLHPCVSECVSECVEVEHDHKFKLSPVPLASQSLSVSALSLPFPSFPPFVKYQAQKNVLTVKRDGRDECLNLEEAHRSSVL